MSSTRAASDDIVSAYMTNDTESGLVETGSSDVVSASIVRTHAQRKAAQRKKRGLLCGGALLVGGGLLFVLAFVVMNGSGGGGGGGSSGGSSSNGGFGAFVVPDQLSIISTSGPSSSGARVQGGSARLQADDYATVNTQEYFDLVRDGSGSFSSVVKIADLLVCIMEKTLYNQPALQNPTKYYAAKIDATQCKYNLGGVNTKFMEVDVRYRAQANGGALIDVFSPGWWGSSSYPREMKVYATAEQFTDGFGLRYVVETYLAPSYEAWSSQSGYLRYYRHQTYQLYNTEYLALKIGQNWRNGSLVSTASVEPTRALLYQDETMDVCTLSASQVNPSMNCGEIDFAFAIAYDSSYSLIQNCTHGCTQYSDLPFVASGSSAGAICYNQNLTDNVGDNYCMYDADTGALKTGDELTGFVWNHSAADDESGKPLGAPAVPPTITYDATPNGCSMFALVCTQATEIDESYCNITEGNVTVTEQVPIYNITYVGNGTTNTTTNYSTWWKNETVVNIEWRQGLSCYNGSLHSCDNHQAYKVGGVEAPAFSLKDGTEMTVGGTRYKVKAGSRLKIATRAEPTPGNPNPCSGLSFAYPSFTPVVYTSAPPQMSQMPLNYKQICHNSGTYSASVETGVQVGSDFFDPQPC